MPGPPVNPGPPPNVSHRPIPGKPPVKQFWIGHANGRAGYISRGNVPPNVDFGNGKFAVRDEAPGIQSRMHLVDSIALGTDLYGQPCFIITDTTNDADGNPVTSTELVYSAEAQELAK